MFDHLDDPEPYVPGPGLEQAVVQRGRSLKRRRRLAAGGAVTAVLLMAGLAGAAAVVDHKLDAIERVDIAGLGEDAGPTDPQTVLFVGTDSDAGLAGADPERTAPFRADTVILARVDPDQNVLTILPLPRDLLVELPDGRHGRLNASFSDGGPEQLVEVIRSNFGIEVDRYVQTDLAGAVAIGDALGGLPLEFSTLVRDGSAELLGSPGCNTYDGSLLLAIARARHVDWLDRGRWVSDGSGDLGRIERQQAVGAALFQRLALFDASDPGHLVRLMNVAAEHLHVDSSATYAELVALFRSVAGSRVVPLRMPVENEVIEGANFLRPTGEADSVLDAFSAPPPVDPHQRGGSTGVPWVPVPCTPSS